ncbi:MAG: DUF2244 domain-containing protein [Pseudomonadota bacterium]
MIASEFDTTGPRGRIVLRPNCSWTWRANTWLVATLTVLSGTLGVVLALRGLWLVLPFVAVEMAVLLACLYYCARKTHVQEVLTFSPEYLEFERGVRRPRLRHRFQRYFTRIFVEPPEHPWYRKRVSLRCRETELEIGSFLNPDETERLIADLRGMIQRLEGVPFNR